MEAERSESDEVFDPQNPQLLLDEIRIAVDGVFDDAFDLVLQEAPEVVGSGGGEKAEAFAKGVKSIKKLVQGVVDKKLGSWENYCLKHVFPAPEEFALPKANESAKDFSLEVELSDPDLDNELDSLRRKLEAAGKEQVELQREITLLEKQSNFSTDFDAFVAKTLTLFEDNSVQEAFQGIMETFPKLHNKMLEMRNESSGDAQCLIAGPSCSKKARIVGHDEEETEVILSILRNK